MDAGLIHTFRMTEENAELIFGMLDDRCATYKNWIVSAVERGQLDYAKELSAKLRKLERLFAQFNMKAKYAIAEGAGEAVKTQHDTRQL